MVKYIFSSRFSICKYINCVRMINSGNVCSSQESIDLEKGTEKKITSLLENASAMEDEIPSSPEEAWATSPYPKGAPERNQGLHSLRPWVDPKETSVILFPGQGTQFVGMGNMLRKIPVVRDMFQSASEILNYDLLNLCLNGPKVKLNRTEYAQPAILVTSLAALEKLREDRPSAIENCVATAGFSLGELAALVFAEVLSFEKAVKLVKVRAESMQFASEMTEGVMVNVIYGPDSKLGDACIKAKEYAESQGVENAYCGISNYLFPHCKIVAGHELAIQFLENNKNEFKLRKLSRLPVSGAFHTPLMQPAIEPFRAALNKIKLSDPAIAVHSNVDGKMYQSADHIRKQLPKQILAPVKWEQTLHILYERPVDMPFPRTFECGPGQTMATVLKMVNKKAWDSCLNVPA